MNQLYPEIDCYNSFQLTVDDLHSIYVEECGNSKGIPVIFLHGGPGSGCNENHRRYFNPDKYRIIIFDQRGCNRSTPQGCIKNNTTIDLLQDIEKIRERLEIEKLLLFGGSWGATLGLLYAENYPERVAGMIFRGTFLARQQDLDWFVKEGANQIFPDHWDEFLQVIPEHEHTNLIDAFYQRVFSDDDEQRVSCARAWSAWASKVVTYSLGEVNNEEEEDIGTILNEVSIELHYAKKKYFITENQILNDIKKLPDVPIMIIHGRRDLTCTLQSSWALHKSLPHSILVIVPDAGHLAGEIPMIDALIKATDKMSDLLS